MVQIKCLSNGLYSLKNSHIPFGMGFQPPPPLTAEFRLNSTFLRLGLPLLKNYFGVHFFLQFSVGRGDWPRSTLDLLPISETALIANSEFLALLPAYSNPT